MSIAIFAYHSFSHGYQSFTNHQPIFIFMPQCRKLKQNLGNQAAVFTKPSTPPPPGFQGEFGSKARALIIYTNHDSPDGMGSEAQFPKECKAAIGSKATGKPLIPQFRFGLPRVIPRAPIGKCKARDRLTQDFRQYPARTLELRPGLLK
jgi:hypothetical protein